MRHDDPGRARRRTTDPLPHRSGRSLKALRTGSLAAAVLLLAGCATSEEVRYGEITSVSTPYPARMPEVEQPLSVGELVAGLRAGQAQAELTQAVRTRGLLAVATAADVDLLLEAGAGPELIDAVHAASEGIAAATSAPPEAAPYVAIPALPPAAVVAPPVYVAPPLYSPYYYPGYYGYPYVPGATFGFSYPHYARPRRVDPPSRPPRSGPPHARPPHARPPGHGPQDSPARPPDARRPGSHPGFVPRENGSQRPAEPRSQDSGRRWNANPPGPRPDEGTPGRWHSGSPRLPSSGTGPTRPYSPPSQHGPGRSRR